MFRQFSSLLAFVGLCAAMVSSGQENEHVIDKRQASDGDSPSGGLPINGIPEIPHLGARVRDCEDLHRTEASPLPSGIYEIHPLGFQRPFQVFCDFETAGGKWTVIQRRLDGSVSFQRGWTDYKDGFGNLDTEFWLGNDKISKMTSQKKYRLRIELTGKTGPPYYASYSFFSVADEVNLYKVALGSYSGNAGSDAMNYHRGMPFSTSDADNDLSTGENCAENHSGGWWFNACDTSNLNGRFGVNTNAGVEWTGHPQGDYLLRFTEMKIRSA